MASVIIKCIEKGYSVDSLLPKIKTLKKPSFKKFLDYLSNLYFNKSPCVTDSEFDLIQTIYESLYGNYTKVGSEPSEVTLEKVKLPYHMGSLDKIRDDRPLALWKSKWNTSDFILSNKLDGVSVLVQYSDKGSVINLYKRGDERVGTDITHLSQYIKLPKLNMDITVRGELIIPIKTFNNKYAEDMKNPRNTVSGLTNSKYFDPIKINDIDFVAYQIYGTDKSPIEQFRSLQSMGFKIADYIQLSDNDLTVDNLTNEVKYRKSRSPYEMDGIVIASNISLDYPSSGNPKHVIAFKISGDTCVTTVICVQWNTSKHGLLKPRVQVEPVSLSGVTIEYASGFNAKFIVDKGVGKGAKIVITRSGDVIPDILEVISPVTPDLPQESYEWNENKVEFITTNFDNNRELNIKRMEFFFKELGAKYLAETTLAKLYDNGINTFKRLFNCNIDDINKIEGFRDKSSERIINSIKDSIRDVPVYRIMAASSLFPNFGTKRLQTIIEAIPDYNKISSDEIRERLLNIKGFKKLVDVFIDNLSRFIDFLNEHDEITIDNEKIETGNKALSGITIVFSGLRGYEDIVEKCGGKVGSAVSRQTSFLVVKNLNSETTKEIKAKELNIPIMLIDEFKDKYLNSE